MQAANAKRLNSFSYGAAANGSHETERETASA
jgi:hypothetical protein